MDILPGSGPLGSGPTGPGSGFSVMPQYRVFISNVLAHNVAIFCQKQVRELRSLFR